MNMLGDMFYEEGDESLPGTSIAGSAAAYSYYSRCLRCDPGLARPKNCAGLLGLPPLLRMPSNFVGLTNQ